MSQYRYLPLLLEPDSIRLLRLMPHDDGTAPLQCQVLDYSLQESGKGTHLYEALSYAWGDSTKPLSKSIFIDTYYLPVTVNLHAALSRLRDHSFQRIIWVDAICINQDNLDERKKQVRLMAKIYSKAQRVIVWLGEANAADLRNKPLEAIRQAILALEGIRIFVDKLPADSSNNERIQQAILALKEIRTAADKEPRDSSSEINQQAILALLQRQWFKRIWVLQEVAVARHIVMMCGSMEIDGYAFCLGLKSLKLYYESSPKLQTVPSVANLIEQAGLRSKHTTNSLERFSLAEVIDMFHTRKASDVRDKVYALLGMSSDNPSLSPDYTVSWKDLFQQLVKFLLGKDVSVETSNHSLRAVIKSKGCILGQVTSVRRHDKQKVNITSKNTAWYLGDKWEWTLSASAKCVEECDIVCILQGASKPSIIRRCKDYFAVVVIAATPLNVSGSLGRPEPSKLMTHFPRDLLLVWDWENSLEDSQDQEEYETWTKNGQSQEHSKVELGDHLDKVTRTWNVALVLGDLKEYGEAEERLREAIEGYEMAIGKERLHMLKGQYGLTPLSWVAGNGYFAAVKLLLAKDSIDPDLKDSQHSRTPLSWAAGEGHEAVVKLLLEKGQAAIYSWSKYSETPHSRAAKGGHEAVVKLLCQATTIKH